MNKSRATVATPATETPGRAYLTIPEALNRLSMSRKTFYRYVMPQIQVLRVGRLVRIPVSELEAWEAERTRPTL